MWIIGWFTITPFKNHPFKHYRMWPTLESSHHPLDPIGWFKKIHGRAPWWTMVNGEPTLDEMAWNGNHFSNSSDFGGLKLRLAPKWFSAFGSWRTLVSWDQFPETNQPLPLLEGNCVVPGMEEMRFCETHRATAWPKPSNAFCNVVWRTMRLQCVKRKTTKAKLPQIQDPRATHKHTYAKQSCALQKWWSTHICIMLMERFSMSFRGCPVMLTCSMSLDGWVDTSVCNRMSIRGSINILRASLDTNFNASYSKVNDVSVKSSPAYHARINCAMESFSAVLDLYTKSFYISNVGSWLVTPPRRDQLEGSV